RRDLPAEDVSIGHLVREMVERGSRLLVGEPEDSVEEDEDQDARDDAAILLRLLGDEPDGERNNQWSDPKGIQRRADHAEEVPMEECGDARSEDDAEDEERRRPSSARARRLADAGEIARPRPQIRAEAEDHAD